MRRAGELDSILIPSYPFADPQTGAAHACGHNASITGMLGAGMGLIDSGVMAELDGNISLMAVPAEELVELEYRNRLRQEDRIVFLAGKQLSAIRAASLPGGVKSFNPPQRWL